MSSIRCTCITYITNQLSAFDLLSDFYVGEFRLMHVFCNHSIGMSDAGIVAGAASLGCRLDQFNSSGSRCVYFLPMFGCNVDSLMIGGCCRSWSCSRPKFAGYDVA